MAAGSLASGTIVMADAGHGAGLVLAGLLAERGFDVTAWAPGGAPAMSSDRISWRHEPDIEALGDGLGAARAVIFNHSALDEAALLAEGRLADAVAADGALFLRSLQAVSRALIDRGGGQIWVLAPDDSFAYYLPLPAAPVTHHTRIGAIRALAKELARFGVAANAAVLQPSPETVAPAAWQAARAGLGSYAQRFRPVPLAAVAETLAFWLSRPALPLNGSVIHFGNGAYDGHF